jgi:L-alanine-DL-glutamate epimerase-like enolase superfamily enzyme
MKIQQVKINFVRLPLEEPLVGAPPMPGMLREFFTVQVLTDDGIEGIGITTFGGKLIRTLKTALDEFSELIKGEDPLRTEQVVAKLRAASAPCGPGGVVGHPRQGIWRSAGAVARRPARPCAGLR